MMNGTLFEASARRGYQYLRAREQMINDLNVFPVSDGDTGTNMSLTLENGLKYAESTADLGVYIKKLSRGMLLGARGNSGVIFSQIVKGMSLVLAEKKEASTMDMVDALIKGYETAYAAVAKPAEGTILTVAREGIERIRFSITEETSVEELMKRLHACMKDTLQKTPELLPVLKEAGVVDSGGMGLCAFFEGFHSSENFSPVVEPRIPVNPSLVKTETHSEDDHGYCTEFILRPASRFFTLEELKSYLDTKGTSIVALQDADLVKVHVHTECPLEILNFVSDFGTFHNVKIENLDVMCSEQAERVLRINKDKISKKGIAIVAVAQGDGIIRTLQELGCDVVINGGQTMNTSAEEFVEVFEALPVDNIIVLPNDPNVIFAAKQGAELSNKANIHVLETKSMAEGYFAMSMVVGGTNDVMRQLHDMEQGMHSVVTLQLAKASVSRTIGGVACKESDYVVLHGHTMVAANENAVLALKQAFAQIGNLEDLGTMLIFRGQMMEEDTCEEIAQEICEDYSNLGYGIIEGGQDVFDLIIGITE